MNKVFLIGNLTRDPELSTTNSGISVCRISIAVSRRFANADGSRETDFFNVVAWRAIAENCAKYLKKGSKAAISGSIQTRSYEGTDGVKRYITEIIADNVEFLANRGGAGEGDCRLGDRDVEAVGVAQVEYVGGAQLLQVVDAGNLACLVAGLAQSGKQHGGQNRNDGDNYQQFNQSK